MMVMVGSGSSANRDNLVNGLDASVVGVRVEGAANLCGIGSQIEK
jgi:hypothetical protein